VLRQANTTFVNLRAALDDIEPLIDTAKPATKNLAPFLAELRPVLSKFIPFTRNLGLALSRPGAHNDSQELLATLPAVQELASKAFPHAETAIADFQPQLNFIRSYTPDVFNGIAKLGQVSGYYDGDGNYVRGATALENIFKDENGTLIANPKAEQFVPFGSPAKTPTRCPGGAAQAPGDNSAPYVNPPHGGSSVTSSECNPSQAVGDP
jgi:phospholipid/cholesterol/gamma-HCH transport system substrate-binding protein